MKRIREERSRRKTVIFTNLKQTSTKCGVDLCGVLGNAGKYVIAYIWKRHMDEFVNVSHVFINDISRHIATFGDLNKITKNYFIF